MRARQGRLQSELFGDDIPKLFPIVYEHQSDSACIDNALEFLVMGGRSLAQAMMMLIPSRGSATRRWTWTGAGSTSTTPR